MLFIRCGTCQRRGACGGLRGEAGELWPRVLKGGVSDIYRSMQERRGCFTMVAVPKPREGAKLCKVCGIGIILRSVKVG